MAARPAGRFVIESCFFKLSRALKRFRVLCRSKHSECVVELEVGQQSMRFSTGKVAKLADGAVVTECGNNATLVTAVSEEESKLAFGHGIPLTVDYKEKAAAGGQFPRTFSRRDVGLPERDILISRRIDRSLRSLFPKGYSCTTQVMGSLWAADGLFDPDITAMNGASAALAVSNIPWHGPVGVVRVGEVDGEFVVNPSWTQLVNSRLNLVVACSEHKVVMVEAFANEVTSDRFCEALRFGFEECQPIIQALQELQKQAGTVKRPFTFLATPVEVLEAVQRFLVERLDGIFSNFTYSKQERDKEMFSVRDACLTAIQEQFSEVDFHVIEDAVLTVTRSVFRRNVLEKAQRCDGRPFDALRPIRCEVDLFKPLHGSSLFQRGETQVFCTATLGSLRSAKQSDATAEGVGDDKEKTFILHYEFPPFCINETGRVGGYNRREVGHGNLAEKALEPVLPKDFPFSIRLTSQVLESNGSSSIATACAGSLALLDAGIPITRPVAGVACGLVTSSDAEDPSKADIERYQLMTDILGIEDFMGDMDFKLAGSRDGITAVQADFKIPGIPLHIVEEAVHKATEDRMKVLDVIEECQSKPREKPKENTPALASVFLPQAKSKKLVGVAGLTIRNLQEETGATISRVEEEQFSVFAPNAKALQETMAKISDLTSEDDHWTEILEVGEKYTAKIVEVREYGVMVELLPDTPTVLLHVREMDHSRVYNPKQLKMKVGDTVDVKYLGRDEHSGRLEISRKALLPKPSVEPLKKTNGIKDDMTPEEFIATFLK
ncbi:polyribonucleotide nucleotidyltransferase 1, mitochondrial-like isoform X1 [Montipora foliosa]|uniref:polyribonucleotide nucleotidyltransferase 1, mitochondrial-like isoform X1 n=2 Tax=Montipora foliosa TaxID=591990 RepID=UPI0035F13B98